MRLGVRPECITERAFDLRFGVVAHAQLANGMLDEMP